MQGLQNRETVMGEFVEGLEQFKRKLQLILDNAKEFDGEKGMPLAEAFSADFMREHTCVSSFEQLVEAGGFAGMDVAAIPTETWEATVRAHTSFASWMEMRWTAAATRARDRLSGSRDTFPPKG